MITRLSVSNYAIIDEVDISFTQGLNAITGETGAGKSILMGALGLLLGDRAQHIQPADERRKTVVEAHFSVPGLTVVDHFFQQHDLDTEESGEVLIRREWLTGGRSRSFINDTPVNLSVLRELGTLLVDLHQQFDTLELTSDSFQRQVLDALAGMQPVAEEMEAAFHTFQALDREWRQKQKEQQEAQAAREYHQFLYDELQVLSLQPGELELLEKELSVLEKAGQYKEQISVVLRELSHSEEPLIHRLKSIQQKIRSLGGQIPALEQLPARMSALVAELDDIAGELEREENRLDPDPQRMERLQDRLSQGFRLLKKHGTTDTAGLLKIHEALAAKLEGLDHLSASLSELELQRAGSEQRCRQLAEQLSRGRSAAIPALLEELHGLLEKVGMPSARLRIALEPGPLSSAGAERVVFLFDANKSQRWEKLEKVASGGELSRLMLCLKSLVAGRLHLPTLVFDEIDAGISGEAARQVGELLHRLSANHQVVAITHLAQIAARGQAHWFIHKEELDGRIRTRVRRLQNEERVSLIARMLSGDNPSEAALRNARELMQR